MKGVPKAFRVAGAALLAIALAGVAEARNPHCAGGIQYVVQGTKDKDKGNLEDYQREMNKAIQQLETCAAEDPADFEALGYLGWAYAELDSSGPAGKWFDVARKGLEAKGDKRKVDWVVGNLNHYWAVKFNEGIGRIQAAQAAYNDFCKQAEGNEVTLKAEAEKNYKAAIVSLTAATLLRPGDPQTIRNLGTTYALMCDYRKASTVFAEGLKIAPADTALQQAKRSVDAQIASQMVDQKDFDKAIAFYTDALKSEPNNADHHVSLGDVYFKRAQTKEGDARKPDFSLAGDEYARGGDLRPGDPDVRFNAALAYQNATLFDKAEAQWRKTLQLRPDDCDALSAFGATLVEAKKCDEAVQALHKAVNLCSQKKELHRQFGAIYTKCGNNAKATEELMIYLAMQNGQPVADPAAQAKSAKEGSAAAKMLATSGPPEEIRPWDADNQKYETWFYWSKKLAYTFSAGTLVAKSDWGAPATSSVKK